MAVKNFYLYDDVAPAGVTLGKLDETAPSSATSATGWTVGQVASNRFAAMRWGIRANSAQFSTTDDLAASTQPLDTGNDDSIRSLNTLTGTFANTSWTFTFVVTPVNGGGTHQGRAKIRVYKSANNDGSSATQLTAALLTGTTCNATATNGFAYTSTVTWTPGTTITFTNEYLFVQIEWNITTAGDNNTDDIMFMVGSTRTVITTPDLSVNTTITPPVDALALAGVVPTLAYLFQPGVFLDDYVLDNGLTVLDTQATHIHICSSAPAIYSDVATLTLGNKNFGAGGCFDVPAGASPNGRKVSSTPITDGSITSSGTARFIAVTDQTNSRLHAVLKLSTPTAVTSGLTFVLASFDVSEPDS